MGICLLIYNYFDYLCVRNKYLYLMKIIEYKIISGSLDVSGNALTSLSDIPACVDRLYCYNNMLKTLPKLPVGLRVLFCNGNNIKHLPELPNSLEYLNCGYNPLECLIPFEFLHFQPNDWRFTYYQPYIESYEGQKNILTMYPDKVNELKEQATIRDDIRKEFAYLLDGFELNLV